MASISLGGAIFSTHQCSSKSLHSVGIVLYTGACLSMALPAYSDGFYTVVLSFCVFEVCVGVFNPWCVKLRSAIVPEEILATVITIWRLPLNGMVVVGVFASDNLPTRQIFTGCSLIYALCAMVLFSLPSIASIQGKKND
mmetsp:Transcript_3714/g.4274  ORF Transcript_3714/g.4274 Transcript_3714/m.4274 type:complete len:140 (-) Transcript_3714:650-1069(-)